jgi:D-glycero-D-manno-heptose 1,7-bisphosphate phosphatase
VSPGRDGLRPAVFLDRDGTLIAEVGHLGDPNGVAMLPGVPDALRRLSDAGFARVMVSNQAGVARGLFTEEDVRAVNGRMVSILEEQGSGLDAMYWCPHHPDFDGPCECRKPKPGMLHRAAEELGLDLEGSWIVGDHPTDALCGLGVGARAIIVISGHTHEHDPEIPPGVPIVADLPAATDLILEG